VGAAIPGFDDAIALAIEAARLMQQAPLIGWDIAVTERGATIVEMNEVPDVFLNQLADRRGVLDRQLIEGIALQKRNAKAHARKIKVMVRQLNRAERVLLGDRV
jgi:hypothetical protein